MMKNWVMGKGDAAARLDPKIAALVLAVADVVVMTGLHTKLGISPEDLIVLMLNIAFALTLMRSIQLSVAQKQVQPAPDEGSDNQST